jgi:hypothetical protein
MLFLRIDDLFRLTGNLVAITGLELRHGIDSHYNIRSRLSDVTFGKEV